MPTSSRNPFTVVSRDGSGASVTTESYPDKLFRGQATYIDPNIRPETRTAQVHVELDNPGQVLKIGMYVNVTFGSMETAERTMPTVPSSAVQNMNDNPVVFVATDKPNVFNIKSVRLDKENKGRYVVLEGLNVGDKSHGRQLSSPRRNTQTEPDPSLTWIERGHPCIAVVISVFFREGRRIHID